MRAISVILLLAWLGSPLAAQTIRQADLLRRMIDVDRLTQPPTGETTLLFSSYDRAARTIKDGRYVNWDANNDAGQFEGRTADGWDIMGVVEGPGVVNRMWFESGKGELRVLLDGAPAIQANIAEVFAGNVAPFGAPFTDAVAEGKGLTLRFPMGFARRCELLCRDVSGAYQVDVTRLPEKAQVQPFQAELDADGQAALEAVAKALRTGLSAEQLFGGRKVSSQAAQEDVSRGKALRWEIKKPGVIRGLYIATTDRVEPRELYALHNCVLRIFWDDDKQPAIETPLPEFFGAGFQRNPYSSMLVGTDFWTDMPGHFPVESWFMYCYFPMPFAKGARIEIENLNERPIGLMLYLRVDREPPAASSLRFNARFRKEDPCKTFDFPVLETSGRGRLVGVGLNVDCPRADWWGEGDHKIWVDDDDFPSIAGAGTADLFGNTKGFKQHIGPLQGVTLAAPYGKNSAYRWFVADCVNFERNIRFTLENWQKNNANDVYYSTVAYWYGEPGKVGEFASLPARRLDVPGRRIPGSVEIEGYVRGEGWGRTLKQKYAGAEVSGGEAVVITTNKPVDIAAPVKEAGRYRVKLYAVPGRPFTTVEVRDAADKVIGVVKYNRASDGGYVVGEAELATGVNYFRVVCARTTALDCWALERIGP